MARPETHLALHRMSTTAPAQHKVPCQECAMGRVKGIKVVWILEALAMLGLAVFLYLLRS